MSRKTFQGAYAEYTKAYAEKNHVRCLEIFTGIDLKSYYGNFSEQVTFLLRTACYCLFSSKSSNMKYNISIADGWKNVLFEASRGSDYKKFFSILSYFITNLERYVPLIGGVSSTIFNLSNWLQAINKYSFQVLNNAKIIDDSAHTKRKGIYLQLTQTLLIFVYAEAKQSSLSEHRCKFTESRRFLSSCQQFGLFKEGMNIKQYNLCYDLLDKLLIALTSEAGDGKLGAAMDTFLAQLKSLTKSNELRATLTQDNYVTLSKILKACTPQFVKVIDSKDVTGCFNVIGYVGHAVRQMKSDKPFCTSCEGIGYHCSHEMAMMAMEIYSMLIEKEDIDKAIIEKFATIISFDFDAVSKLKCAKALDTQRDATSKFKNLAKKCETKEKAKFVIPAIKSLLKHYDDFTLMDEVKNFDKLYILYYLFNVINATDDLKELNNVGYLFMAFHSSASNHPSHFDQVAWIVAKKQKEQKENKEITTPLDQFSNPTKESLYGLKLPKNFNINKLSLEFLKAGFKYSVLSPELSNKIVHQLLMTASTKDSTSLRFVLCVQTMKFDKVTSERVDKLVHSLDAKSKTDFSIALQLAALKYLRLNFECAQIQEKYNSLSITGSLSEEYIKSETSIFRDVTLDREKHQIETLRYVKDRFIKFTEFYLSKTVEERNEFEDEKELLLREFKVVANQFVLRGYLEDGLELYMTLFKLSKVILDEFGLIDACAFFAENRSDFKQKFPDDNLKSIIEECFTACVTKLKELNSLSMRRQNQVCFCLLNLVSYYYEDDGNYKNEIHLILAFIYKTIGGTGDKDFETAMEFLVGPIGNVKQINNESKKPLSEAIRIKFYSVLFTIITKYGGPSAFHPNKFIQFVMNHTKTYLGLYYDSTATIPILLFNMIPQMVLWLEGQYELNVEIPALLLTLLKLSLKSGYALRTVNLMVVLLQMDLLGEKLTSCKIKLNALEYIMLTDIPNAPEHKKFGPMLTVDDKLNLCEPIRKQATVTSPMKCISPKQTIGSVTTQTIRYLPNHKTGCECGVCFSLQNKFAIFCVAIAYARYAYLNDEEFDSKAKGTVFTELLQYWEKCRKEKALPKSDLYYMISARMLLYDGHFQWKFEKNYAKAKQQLSRGLKGLERVKRGADAQKRDIQYQIDRMQETMNRPKTMTREERYGGPIYINRNKGFIDQTSTEETQPKKIPKSVVKKAAKTQLAVKSTPKPRVNLLDMINNEPPQTHVNFQIHDDGAVGGSELSTPSVKQSTRGQGNKVEETPIRKTSIWTDKVSKTSERPRRVAKPNPAPTDFIDLATSLPPPKRNYKRIPAPSVQIDLTTPPETNSENNAKLAPETPITSKPPPISRPRKPKCPANKDARKVVTEINETFQPKK